MIFLVRFLLVFLFVVFPGDDRKKKGRKGNEEYARREFATAAQLYQEALGSEPKPDDVLTSRLSNNLGCALNREEEFDQASRLFRQAFETAASTDDRTRAAYNAGNTAFQAQDPTAALEHYKQALLSDPNNEEARYNYEFVRRLLEQQSQQDQQQQQSDDSDQEDSDEPQQQDADGEQQRDEEEQQEQSDPEDEKGEQEQEPQEQQPENEMTPEQAEQILQALQTDEEELMRQVWKMRGKAKKVDKDW